MHYYFYTPLLEGSRDNILEPYVEFYRSRGVDMSISQFKQMMLKKLTVEAGMDTLSMQSNYYLAGAIRYYFNGDLTNNKRLNAIYPQYTDRFKPEVCDKLNRIMLILRNAYIDSVGTKWAQPEDFGKLSIEKLFKKYDKVLDKQQAEKDKIKEKPTEEVSPLEYNRSKDTGGYSMEVIITHDQCRKYNSLTSPGAWCITYNSSGNYDSYTRHNNSHFIIFKKEGCDNLPYKPGPGYPKDKYGLSMLAVQQSNEDGHFICCTTRWNHGGYREAPSIPNADYVYKDAKTFCEETGIPEKMLTKAFEAYRENRHMSDVLSDEEKARRRAVNAAKKKAVVRKFKYAQMMINGGKPLGEIFDGVTLISGNGKVGKSVYLVKFSGDNDLSMTLCVRGKLLYDQVILTDHVQWVEPVSRTHSKKERNPDVIRINMGYVSGSLLFDTRRNQIVKIGGRKTFYDCEPLNYDGDYTKLVYIRVNSKRNAIYDCRTGKPLSINGEEVFYTIRAKSGWGGIDYGERIPKNAILQIQLKDRNYWYSRPYDEEYAFYDIEKNVQVDAPDNERIRHLEGLSRTSRITSGRLVRLNEKTYICYEINDSNNNDWRITKALYDVAKNDFVTLGGHQVFNNFEEENNLIFYKNFDNSVGLIDINRGDISQPILEWISSPGSEVQLRMGYWGTSDKSCSIIRVYKFAGADNYFLYNNNTGNYVRVGGNIRFSLVDSLSGSYYKIRPLDYDQETNDVFYIYNSEDHTVEKTNFERIKNWRPPHW